ncbi:unnamed protein product [Somion occarium]|uniref:Uncharacterized protein n=1 Tax=Somion occarium TaxID=3059160 RepID=A0ABP1D5R8_9APHY
MVLIPRSADHSTVCISLSVLKLRPFSSACFSCIISVSPNSHKLLDHKINKEKRPYTIQQTYALVRMTGRAKSEGDAT